MRELKIVFGGMILTGIIVEIVLSLLPTDQALLLLDALIVILFFGGLVSTAYLLRLYFSDQSTQRGWLILSLAVFSVAIEIGMAAIALSATLPVLFHFHLSGRDFVLLLGSGVCLIATFPIMIASLFWMIEQRR